MSKLARSRFTLLATVAVGAGSFVGGALSADSLSRVQLPATPTLAAIIFLLFCAYLALQGFRRA